MADETREIVAVAVRARRAAMTPERAAAVDVARALETLPAILEADPDSQPALRTAREINAGLDALVRVVDRRVCEALDAAGTPHEADRDSPDAMTNTA